MVAPFTDLRDGDAENLIYVVLSGIITRPTVPASQLISAHIASRAGRFFPWFPQAKESVLPMYVRAITRHPRDTQDLSLVLLVPH